MKKNSIIKPQYFYIGITAITLTMVIFTGDFSKIVVWLLSIYSFDKGQKAKYFFSPYYLFIITFLSYIMYNPDWGGFFMDELTIETRILCLLSFIMLLAGASVLGSKKIKPIQVGKHTGYFYLVLSIGFFPTLLSLYLFGNITDLEGSELAEAKSNYTIPVIGQLSYFLPAAIIVACKQNDFQKVVIAVAFSFFAAILTMSKTAMVVSLLFLVIGLLAFRPQFINNYLVRKISSFSIPLLIILLILMFSYNNTKRNTESGFTTMEFTDAGNVTDVWGTDVNAQNLFLNYAYFVQPWSNLNYNIKYNENSGDWGGYTLSQFAKKMGIELEPKARLHPTFFNTYTYLVDYYLDFGIIGMFIMSFFLGMLIYFCYVKFGLSDDPLLLSFYTLVSYATIMMFFSNHFNNGYLLNYFITFGLFSLLTRRTGKVK